LAKPGGYRANVCDQWHGEPAGALRFFVAGHLAFTDR